VPSARNGQGPTRRERRRAREQAIVATTRALIDERGRRDVAVDEIARAAGVNKALIYRSFGSDPSHGRALKREPRRPSPVDWPGPAPTSPDHQRSWVPACGDRDQ